MPKYDRGDRFFSFMLADMPTYVTSLDSKYSNENYVSVMRTENLRPSYSPFGQGPIDQSHDTDQNYHVIYLFIKKSNFL